MYRELNLVDLSSIQQVNPCVIIDIRTSFEYFIIPNPLHQTINIPMHDDEFVERDAFIAEICTYLGSLETNPKRLTVILICRTGRRTKIACELLSTCIKCNELYGVKNGISGDHF